MISRQLARTALPILTLGATFLMPQAHAQTVAYNNFGSGNSFSNSSGWDLETFGATSFGFTFTPSVSGTLTGIDVAIGYFGGVNGGVQVLLSTSPSFPTLPSSIAPPSPLETWTLSGALPTWNTNFAPQALASVNKPSLSAGTVYFIYAKTLVGGSWNRWQFNMTGDVAPSIRSNNNSTYGLDSIIGIAPKGAFRVTVTPAPEPATLGLLALGSFMLVRRRKTT